MRIIGIGDNVCDKYRTISTMFPGGQALNVAVYCRLQGCFSAYMGVFGTDRVGNHIKETLTAVGVEFSRCRTYEGENGYAVVDLIDGDRSFVSSNKGGVLREHPLRLTASDLSYIDSFEVVHTSNNSYFDDQLPLLKPLVPLVSYDFSRSWEDIERRQHICPWLDIGFLSCSDSDEDSVTIEYGSDGDFNQTTFDISNADIQIGGNKKQGGPLAANLNLKIGYYVENGDYIAVSVYGDGSESMTPSWVYNYEMKSVSGNVRYNDDSTMTIETGSDGDFYEMTFDISSAELDIQVDEVIGVSGLRTSLNVDVNYYVKDGVNIATYVYSDGTEYFSPSQLYNMEQRNTQAEEDTQEYEESGDEDYIEDDGETFEDY